MYFALGRGTAAVFMRSIASFWRSHEGSVLVEATIVIPVLFVLSLGIFEFSWYFYNQHMAFTGVRDAARYLARMETFDANGLPASSESTNPCTLTTPVANAKNLATTGSIAGGTSLVTGWTTGAVSVSCTAINNSAFGYDGPATFYIVTVTTTFADPALGFFASLGLGTPNITITHSERAIGPG
jgi:Flp pilus assembly protein TadG